MIRDSNGRSDPVRTPMKPKSSEQAPEIDVILVLVKKFTEYASRNTVGNIPPPRLVFSIEVRQSTFKIFDISLAG